MDLFSIEQLLENGKVAEAYQAIQTYLLGNPDDKDGLKLQEKVIKAANKQNQENSEVKLSQMEEFINEGKFQEAITIGLQLREFIPDNKKLIKLIDKAYSKHNKNQSQAASSAQNQLLEQVNELKKQNQYPKAIQLVEAAYAKNPSNTSLVKLGVQLREELVDKKIQANRRNMDLLAPEKVVKFLKDLQKFSPKHKQLRELIMHYQSKLQKKTLINRKHYIKEAKRQIKVLYFQGKFDKSIQACLELIKADPKNKLAKKFYAKNQKGIARQNHQVSYKSLKDYFKKLDELSPEQVEAEYIRL